MKARKHEYEPASIEGTLERDCELIVEALRRLIEGTCCLVDDDEKTCAWDLFDRMSQALNEHVSFEETWVFPDLAPHVRDEHRAEHRKLSELLCLASWELQCSDGDQFRFYARCLRESLIRHHEREFHADAPCRCREREPALRDANLIHIRKRVAEQTFI